MQPTKTINKKTNTIKNHPEDDRETSTGKSGKIIPEIILKNRTDDEP